MWCECWISALLLHEHTHTEWERKTGNEQNGDSVIKTQLTGQWHWLNHPKRQFWTVIWLKWSNLPAADMVHQVPEATYYVTLLHLYCYLFKSKLTWPNGNLDERSPPVICMLPVPKRDRNCAEWNMSARWQTWREKTVRTASVYGQTHTWWIRIYPEY